MKNTNNSSKKINDSIELLSLTRSKIPQIAEAANQAILATAALKQDELSLSEYTELMDDITHLEKIDKAMFTESVYLKIQQAFIIISEIKNFASL